MDFVQQKNEVLHLRNLRWITNTLPCLKGVTFSKAHHFGYQFDSFLRVHLLPLKNDDGLESDLDPGNS